MDAASLKLFRRTALDGAALYRGEREGERERTRGVAEMVGRDTEARRAKRAPTRSEERFRSREA